MSYLPYLRITILYADQVSFVKERYPISGYCQGCRLWLTSCNISQDEISANKSGYFTRTIQDHIHFFGSNVRSLLTIVFEIFHKITCFTDKSQYFTVTSPANKQIFHKIFLVFHFCSGTCCASNELPKEWSRVQQMVQCRGGTLGVQTVRSRCSVLGSELRAGTGAGFLTQSA